MFSDVLYCCKNRIRDPCCKSVATTPPTGSSIIRVFEVSSVNYWTLLSSALVDWNLKLFLFQIDNEKVMARVKCSWVCWIVVIIASGSEVVKLGKLICLLYVQSWGFLKYRWMILEHFYPHHRFTVINFIVNWLPKFCFYSQHKWGKQKLVRYKISFICGTGRLWRIK